MLARSEGPEQEGAVRLEDYTPDTICRALGLPGFWEDRRDGDRGLWIRLLLMPSFDPEVCVTMFTNDTGATADVRTFSKQFWRQPSPLHCPPLYKAIIDPGQSAVEAAVRSVNQNLADMRRESRKGAVLDGMPVEMCWKGPAGAGDFQANVWSLHTSRHVLATIFQDLHGRLRPGYCRNAIAAAARYVELELQTDPVAEPAAGRTVLVLGNESARREVIERLGRTDEQDPGGARAE